MINSILRKGKIARLTQSFRVVSTALILSASGTALAANSEGEKGDAPGSEASSFSVETAGCGLEIGWGSASNGSVGGKPKAPTLEATQELPACELQWDGEELLYICQCAQGATPHSGALEPSSKEKRPRLGQICGEKLREHCGEIKERVVRECENPQGRCRVRAVGIDGEYPSSQLSVSCNCEGERGWSYEERGSKRPDYSLAKLDEICVQELSACPGSGASGLGDAFELPKNEDFYATASCRFEQGECRISHRPQNNGYIECECDNRFEIRSDAVERFENLGTDKLLDYCDGQMYECQDMLLAGKGPTGDWQVKQGKPGEEEDDEPKGETPKDQDEPAGDSDGDDEKDDEAENENQVPGSGKKDKEGCKKVPDGESPHPEVDVKDILAGLGCQTGAPGSSWFGLCVVGLLLLRRRA